MGLLLPLAICALAAGCRARSEPLVVPEVRGLLSRGCSDSEVLHISDYALRDINKDQKEGYVLILNRVSDVREHKQFGPGFLSLFYLTLDVLGTDCPVLSKKSWKDCRVWILHESVYGQCKAILYASRVRRMLYLPAYNCTLRPVSRRTISRMCPDCPVPSPTDLSDPSVLEAATESLAKYNRESTSKQYSLVKITKASSQQWVFGPAYFVEYLIKESPCTKSQASSCSLQLSDSKGLPFKKDKVKQVLKPYETHPVEMEIGKPAGLCKGSLSQEGIEKFVSVKCEFFELQAPAPGGENSAPTQGPVNLPKVEESQHEGMAPTNATSEAVPRGSVQYLPDWDDEKPEGSQEKDPSEAFPVQLDLTTNPLGENLEFSFFPGPIREKLFVLPFPKSEHRSPECPGPAQVGNPFILPP